MAKNEEQPRVLADATTQEIYAELLKRYDKEPTRDGLLRTPERMAKSMAFLTKGYEQDPQAALRVTRTTSCEVIPAGLSKTRSPFTS